uniref:Uncharacterized protein n=1 Tax=Setaria italica TaxID=4555 RepID=K3YF14_SETIT
MTTEYRVFSQPLKFCSQKWPDRHSWTKYFRNMVQPSRHGKKVPCILADAPLRK